MMILKNYNVQKVKRTILFILLILPITTISLSILSVNGNAEPTTKSTIYSAQYNASAGNQFYKAVHKKAMEAIEGIFKFNLYTIQYPTQGDFYWNYLNLNQLFNENTLDYINARVSKGGFIDSIKLSSPGGFPNGYYLVLENIAYKLSSKSQKKLIRAQQNAAMEAQAIISEYQTMYGEITQNDMDEVGVTTKQHYVISYILGSIWSGRGDYEEPLEYTEMQRARNLRKLLPKMPASGSRVLTPVRRYLQKTRSVNYLCDKLESAAWILEQLKYNASYPDAYNGGIRAFDPVTGKTIEEFQTGYDIKAGVSKISNDLQNKGRTIVITMETQQASHDQISVV